MKKVLLIATFQEGAYSYVIKNVLRDNGYIVYPFDHRKQISIYGKEKTNYFLRQQIKTFSPDFILSLKARGIDLNIIKDAPCKTINWWLDNAKRFNDFEDNYKVYDKTYLCESGQGYPWMPIGIDPKIHHPVFSDEEEWKSEVVFVGTAHPKRSAKILNIVKYMPWNIKIWGNSWNPQTPFYQGKAIYWHNLMKAYTNSKIVLNSHYIKGITPNMRCIEAPSSGTAMLSDTGEGLESILKKDKEYIAYDNKLQAKRLIAKYLEDDDEREKIARAGYKRVIKDHLLIDKLEEMFK